VSGRKLAAAIAAIAILTFVLPPLAARQVNLRRIDRAREAAARLASALRGDAGAALAEVAGPLGREPFVLAGPGAAPVFGPGLGWRTDRVLALSAISQRLSNQPTPSADDAIDAAPDPWGNQYLVVVGVVFGGVGSTMDLAVAGDSRSSITVAVVSAGPNGTIETPFAGISNPRGDDIISVR
jgi:hypothetical protein